MTYRIYFYNKDDSTKTIFTSREIAAESVFEAIRLWKQETLDYHNYFIVATQEILEKEQEKMKSSEN